MRLAACLLLTALVLCGREVRVRLSGRGVITLPLEEYVAGVLMGEASTFSSAEARKAMAVAARSFAVHYAGRHRAEGFDFCEATHCQDFRARDGITPAIREAVEATERELLWFEGRPAATHYGKHCGGHSAAGREIWPDLPAPYLRAMPDTFCVARGRAEWVREVQGPLEILRRSPSGRVLLARLHRATISPERFPSNLFDAVAGGSRARGYGSGHGVGLCQTGAEERGKAGQSYEQILAGYYPGTSPGISASGLRWRHVRSERLEVYAVSEATVREVGALADAALTEAERLTGLRAARRPRVRVYPSVAIYRDATGDSGRVAATASGNLVRLQPPGVLRSHGILQSTLLHEMLHILLESGAHPGVPVWFREELAQYLGGSARGPRVSALARQYGQSTVLSWLRSGLPPEVARDRRRR